MCRPLHQLQKKKCQKVILAKKSGRTADPHSLKEGWKFQLKFAGRNLTITSEEQKTSYNQIQGATYIK